MVSWQNCDISIPCSCPSISVDIDTVHINDNLGDTFIKGGKMGESRRGGREYGPLAKLQDLELPYWRLWFKSSYIFRGRVEFMRMLQGELLFSSVTVSWKQVHGLIGSHSRHFVRVSTCIFYLSAWVAVILICGSGQSEINECNSAGVWRRESNHVSMHGPRCLRSSNLELDGIRFRPSIRGPANPYHEIRGRKQRYHRQYGLSSRMLLVSTQNSPSLRTREKGLAYKKNKAWRRT
jgi:hypothetical protein